MRLNPPTIFVFLISLILITLAVASQLGIFPIPFKFPNQNFWFAVVAYLVLAVGNLVRGL